MLAPISNKLIDKCPPDYFWIYVLSTTFNTALFHTGYVNYFLAPNLTFPWITLKISERIAFLKAAKTISNITLTVFLHFSKWDSYSNSRYLCFLCILTFYCGVTNVTYTNVFEWVNEWMNSWITNRNTLSWTFRDTSEKRRKSVVPQDFDLFVAVQNLVISFDSPEVHFICIELLISTELSFQKRYL